MKYVYMLQVDWAKDNDGDVNAVLFESYKEASETFEELLYRIGVDEGYVLIDNSVSNKNVPFKTIVLFDYTEIIEVIFMWLISLSSILSNCKTYSPKIGMVQFLLNSEAIMTSKIPFSNLIL